MNKLECGRNFILPIIVLLSIMKETRCTRCSRALNRRTNLIPAVTRLPVVYLHRSPGASLYASLTILRISKSVSALSLFVNRCTIRASQPCSSIVSSVSVGRELVAGSEGV